MSPGLRIKFQTLADKYQALMDQLADPEIINNLEQLAKTSKEQSDLSPIHEFWSEYLQSEQEIEDAKELQETDDSQLRQLAQQEELELKEKLITLEQQLYKQLIPKDPHDGNNIFLEIRAGTGGNEAALFVGDLYNMYQRYAESQRWKVEILSTSESEVGGYKELIARIIGKGAYSKLKFESGAHRVQRVPTTESQGRVHTSACTVAVMPEVTSDEEIDINTQDLRIDTFRASGAGGQHVNKTDSAIRITHLPTGVVVECQEGRSQHQNKAKAMTILSARLLDKQRQEAIAQQTATRKSLVGSGDRSERIRTYNYPQGRVTDHRINLTEYKLEQIMQGSLAIIIEPLTREHQAELMTLFDDETATG